MYGVCGVCVDVCGCVCMGGVGVCVCRCVGVGGVGGCVCVGGV